MISRIKNILFRVFIFLVYFDGYFYEAIKNKGLKFSLYDITEAFFICISTYFLALLINYFFRIKRKAAATAKYELDMEKYKVDMASYEKELTEQNTYEYIDDNLTSIIAHRRKYSTSCNRTGRLFKK